MRYNEPETGPRQMPVLGACEAGKSAITAGSTFSIDLVKNVITLHDNGTVHDLGPQIIYIVE